jgi:hypothetical protein
MIVAAAIGRPDAVAVSDGAAGSTAATKGSGSEAETRTIGTAGVSLAGVDAAAER